MNIFYTLLSCALGGSAFVWLLYRISIAIHGHPNTPPPQDNEKSRKRPNPYLDYPFEGDFEPVLNRPDAAQRIEECATALHNARQRLAEQFGRQVFMDDEIKCGHDLEFIRRWKAVCEVARAKYGQVIYRKGLKLAGYSEPDYFEVIYGRELSHLSRPRA